MDTYICCNKSEISVTLKEKNMDVKRARYWQSIIEQAAAGNNEAAEMLKAENHVREDLLLPSVENELKTMFEQFRK